MKKLVDIAIKAMDKAYSPYSNFKVGAALVTKNNKIFTGCNIESVSFTPTCCAERTAFFKAISEGEKEFESITVVGGLHGKLNDFCFPCGVCRQVMTEFCDKDFKIYVSNGIDIKEYTLEKLFPHSFNKEDIK